MKPESQDVLAADYAEKRKDYFDYERAEMLRFVPTACRRILDVGCGSGGFGAAIRNRAPAEVWGIEPDVHSADKATRKLDKAIQGSFSPDLNLPTHYFDCIVFNDVLEHLLNPASALQLAGSLLSDGGVVVASIPNIGHFPIVWRLAVRGEWEYKERGILDRTHLRFFTRSSIRKLLQENGFQVERIEGINAWFKMDEGDQRLWRIYWPLSFIPAAGIHDMRYLQFALVARLNGN